MQHTVSRLYLDILLGRKMGLVTQILPTLFLVILLFSPKTRRIKCLKVQSYLHSGNARPKSVSVSRTLAKVVRIWIIRSLWPTQAA